MRGGRFSSVSMYVAIRAELAAIRQAVARLQRMVPPAEGGRAGVGMRSAVDLIEAACGVLAGASLAGPRESDTG